MLQKSQHSSCRHLPENFQVGAKTMQRKRDLILPIALVLIYALAAVASASAQNGPIKILVGVPPGGAVELGARLAGEKLQGRLGQPVVAENKPGASNSTAAHALKHAKPHRPW